MTTEPTFTYARADLEFAVYANRIEIKEGWMKRPKTILLRSITSIDVKGFAPKLHIHTADGVTASYQLGTQNEAARQAILALL